VLVVLRGDDDDEEKDDWYPSVARSLAKYCCLALAGERTVAAPALEVLAEVEVLGEGGRGGRASLWLLLEKDLVPLLLERKVPCCEPLEGLLT
jgi:hypothetical protein